MTFENILLLCCIFPLAIIAVREGEDHGLYKFPVHPSGNEKTIELRAAVQKDCLVIRCRNTAAAPQKKDRSDPLRSHGLGLDILSRLAKTYGGSFQAGYGDGEYTAILILRFPEK